MSRVPAAEASLASSSSSLSCRRPGCGRRSAGSPLVSSRSTPSSRRISVSAARAVSPIEDSRCAPAAGIPGVVSRAVSACTAIMEMWWATTSCRSREMRARSPRAVCSSRVLAMTWLVRAVRLGLAAGPACYSGPGGHRGQRGQQHGEDPGSAPRRDQRGPARGMPWPGPRPGTEEPPRPSRYRTSQLGDEARHGQRGVSRQRQHARRGNDHGGYGRPRPQQAERQRGSQAEQQHGKLPGHAGQPGPREQHLGHGEHPQQPAGHGRRVRGGGDPPSCAASVPRASHSLGPRCSLSSPAGSLASPEPGVSPSPVRGIPAAGIPRASGGEDGSLA